MSAEVVDWQDELQIDHRRRLRNAALVSLALHGVLFAAFTLPSSRPVPPMPEVIAVELVAAPPGVGRPSGPREAPAPSPSPKPAPAPQVEPPAAPEPPPPAPPPPPKAPVQVLPEETPGRIRKAEPTPPEPSPEPEVSRPAPKPSPKPAPKPPPAPEPPVRRAEPEPELSYADAMAALDEELGGDEASALLAPTPAPQAQTGSEDSGGQPTAARPGAIVSPELAAWNQATRRRIQSAWVTPPHFRGRGLATQLELRLSATGEVLGEPRVLRSSGDPYFDDNAIRGVLMASPLPPPPEPGRRSFLFRSEAN